MAEMERYGMTVKRGQGFNAEVIDYQATQDLRVAAAKLAKSKRSVESLQRKQQSTLFEASQHLLIVGGSSRAVSPEVLDPIMANVEKTDEEIAAAKLKHAKVQTQIEAEHPALARYESADDLEGATSSRGALMRVAWDLDENLINIQKTRNALASGELSVFRLPEVIALTSQTQMVREGSMRAKVVEERVTADQPSFFRTIAITVIAIGLGLLAAAPTGGASLGTTAVVVGAEIAGLTLEALMLRDSIRDYQVSKAASGTDPDQARALSQEDPSLFWLAVEVLGAGVGAAAALKAFKGIAAARRSALATKTPEELTTQLEDLKLLTEGLPVDSRRRLEREVLEQHPDAGLVAQVESNAASGWFNREPNADEMWDAMGDYTTQKSQDHVAAIRGNPELNVRFAHLSDEELAAVGGYTGADYSKLNVALREKDPKQLDEMASYLRYADDGLAKLPTYEGLLYRGTDLSAEQIRRYVPGKDVIEDAFTSASKDADRAFGGNVRFEIESKQGPDVEDISFLPGEREVLFRPGTMFHVLDKFADGDTVVIRLVEK